MKVSQVIRIVLKGMVNLKRLRMYIGTAQKMVFTMKVVIPNKPLANPVRKVSTVSLPLLKKFSYRGFYLIPERISGETIKPISNDLPYTIAGCFNNTTNVKATLHCFY